jgi:hypothetical protein
MERFLQAPPVRAGIYLREARPSGRVVNYAKAKKDTSDFPMVPQSEKRGHTPGFLAVKPANTDGRRRESRATARAACALDRPPHIVEILTASLPATALVACGKRSRLVKQNRTNLN